MNSIWELYWSLSLKQNTFCRSGAWKAYEKYKNGADVSLALNNIHFTRVVYSSHFSTYGQRWKIVVVKGLQDFKRTFLSNKSDCIYQAVEHSFIIVDLHFLEVHFYVFFKHLPLSPCSELHKRLYYTVFQKYQLQIEKLQLSVLHRKLTG